MTLSRDHAAPHTPTRTGDPVVLGHLAQQEELGQLDGCRDLAVAEIDIHSRPPVRLAGIGATSSTPMEVGSISKVLSGLVIADSVRRRELALTAPVSAYLPELEGSPAAGVTMRELATHTAGYAEFDPSVIRRAAWRARFGLNYLDRGSPSVFGLNRAGRRQRPVSAGEHCEPMPIDVEVLLRRLIGGDDTAPAEILDRAQSDDSARLLVAAALVAEESGGFLARAAASATTTRDRQLVAIATAHLNDNADLLDALARDHLSDHPDCVIAAWIAAQHAPAGLTRPDQS